MAYSACKKIKLSTDRVCAGLTDRYEAEMFYIFQRVALRPREVCGILLGNECGHVTSSLHNWDVSLPPFPERKIQHRSLYRLLSRSGVSRVLHLSDTHFDPLYLEGSNADCKELLCCRIADGPAPAPAQASGKWGDYRNCDTPFRTLEHMLKHIKRSHKIDYVIWTGDITPHDIWNTTRSEQVNILHRVSKLVREHLGRIPVFPAIGNHESDKLSSYPHPEVTGEFSIDWLHDEVTKAWGSWLPAGARATLRKGMYYSVKVAPGLRVISLNMNYANNQNWWMIMNSIDPGQQLKWLVKELHDAELSGDKVHIIGHIPPGHNDCLPVWSENYYKIIDRFENTVTGQFFGHSHMDEFEVFYDVKTSTRPTGVAYIAPSISSFDGVNPSYRIYVVDGPYRGTSRAVLDHETYYLNLTEANYFDRPVWRKSYSAKKEYELPSLKPSEWNKLIDRFEVDDRLFQKFVRNYYHRSDFPRKVCSNSCKAELLCQLRSARSHNSVFCHS